MSNKRQLLASILITVALLCAAHIVHASGDSIPELFRKSFQLESEGNYKGALNSVIKILRKDQNNYVATLRAGWISQQLMNYQYAIKYYKKAIQLKPSSIEAQLGLALPLMSIGAWSDAEKTVRAVIKIDPLNYYANSRLAWILYSQKRYKAALSVYTRVLQWYPSDTEMQLGVGWTHQMMGNKQAAYYQFKQVLHVHPENVRALQGIEAASR